MRRVGRAIPLDKAGIRALSKDLEQVLVKALAHREGPLGKMTFGQYPHDVRTVDGGLRRVWVRLQAVPSRDFRYVVGGGLGEVRGQPLVVVNVNGSLPAETIWTAANGHSVQDQLYPVLLHELTHAADKFAPGFAETEQQLQDDPAAYFNDPSELRAYMQEVIDEVSGRFDHYEKLQRHFGGRAMGMLLRMSPTWENASPHWTRQNQNRVLKSVYQALEDWHRARRVMARYVGLTASVAARYIRAKASVGPAIRALGKAEIDLDAVTEAMTALGIRSNGDRWKIEADWFYGLGPRNQSRAKTIITSLGHLVGYPDNVVDPVVLKTLSNELKWLEKVLKTSPTIQHGPFEVYPLGVTRPQVEEALGALDAASKALRPKFPKLLYGKVYVTKNLPNGHSTVAKYMEDGDVVYLSLKAKGTTGDVYALCHEFGHRYDRKFWKDKTQREEFNRLSTSTEYGKVVFDGALRKQLADEFMGTVEDRKVGRPSKVSELLSQWLDHQMARHMEKLRPLSLRAIKGDEGAARELRSLMTGDKDITVTTKDVVRPPLHVTTYGGKSVEENFAEAFAHFVLGRALPAEIGKIMVTLG